MPAPGLGCPGAPAYAKPELLAIAPNQVWSWDITQLKGPAKWTCLRPEFPERFGCIEDARAHCQEFFAWYNDQHCHSGIGYMTPHSVHYGLAADMLVIRQATLDAAFLANPKRFKNKRPQLPPMPTAAWINPPPQEIKPTSEPVARTLN